MERILEELRKINKNLEDIDKLLKQKNRVRSSGCICGSESYMSWDCPEHGRMEMDLDRGYPRKVDY